MNSTNYMIICWITAKYDAFDAWFPVLEAGLDLQKSIRRLLSSSSYLLMHLLYFLGPLKNAQKPWATPYSKSIYRIFDPENEDF